jgi:formylglycine-generating enzyme required for sulfatase activity
VVALPVFAALVWSGLVWWGVRAVEAEMKFVRIPAGCFQMGSPDGETERGPDEGPVHEVCLKEFELGKFEVTQEEWRRVMVHNRNPSQYEGDRNPLESISWNEAQTFILLMNVFGRRYYRLPSEAEWEYAARAGTSTARYWGDHVDDGCEYEKMAGLSLKKAMPDAVVANCDNGLAAPAPVGSFKPNPWGLYDILGNVAEWVEDCYVPNYDKAPRDGSAVTTEDCSTAVVRGGSWNVSPRYLRAAVRFEQGPESRYLNLGFRVASTVPP